MCYVIEKLQTQHLTVACTNLIFFFIALVVDLRHDAWKTEITIFWSNSYMYLLDNYSCLLTNTHSAPLLLTIIIENEFHLLFLVTMQTVICTKNSHLAISLAAVQHDFKWLLLTTPCKNTLKTGQKKFINLTVNVEFLFDIWRYEVMIHNDWHGQALPNRRLPRYERCGIGGGIHL